MKYPQLPETEITVMQIIWDQSEPVSSQHVVEILKPVKDWKAQTIYTLLRRLEEKGFLSSEKQGWKRYYRHIVERDDYMRQDTGRYLKVHYKNSLTDLMNALVSGSNVTDDDLHELSSWLKNKEIGDRNDALHNVQYI